MKGPTRLSEGSSLARALLQAARPDAPPAVSRRKALEAAALAASAARTAKTLSLLPALTKAVLPWVAPVLVGAAAVGAGVVASRARSADVAPPPKATSTPPDTAPAPVDATPVESPRQPAVTERSTPDVPPPPAPRPAPAAAHRPAAPPEAAELSRELYLLNAANGALAAGDLVRAAGELDRYAHEFPGGTLREEATALRIRVYARSGDRPRARALYDRLASSDPASPYLESLRDVVGE